MAQKPKPISADQPQLWAEQLAVLKAGLSSGSPDGIRRVRAEIAKLDRRMSAAINRRAIIAQACMRIAAQAITDIDSQNAMHGELTRNINAMAAMVKDLEGLMKGLKRLPAANDQGPTPEVAAKPSRVDPILWLEQHEREHKGEGLTSDQARAAKEIASISEAITRAGQAKIGRIGGGGSGGGGYREPEILPRLNDAYAGRYLPWADYLRDNDPVTLDICVKVAVMGVSIRALARKHRMRREKALDRLQRGLDRYWDERELLPIYQAKVAKAKAEWDAQQAGR
jgi:hypothetical protein